MEPADLAFAGLARQAELVRSGEVSPRELVELALDRIQRLDPQLHAFRVVFAERALAEADQAQARRAAGEERPLLGVPVAIKDDADVAGEVTAFGTGAYGDAPREDSEVVSRLRAAGAVVIGKTLVPELTQWPFTESATWGVTRNPWDPTRTPGGSSGGSGAAVAAGLVPAALGSDGAGSVRIPAAWCGLFGLKPQRDRISLAPKREGWHGLSVYGPIVRSVLDAALFLDVTASTPPGRPFVEAARTAPGKLRIALSFGVAPGILTRIDPEIRRATEETAELLRSLGHDVVAREIDYGPALPLLLARYLRGIHDDAAAMAHPARLERRTRSMARIGGLITPGLLARARAAEAGLAARINAVYDEADVVLTPATAQLPLRVGQLEGRGAIWTLNMSAAAVPFTGVWNVIGQPAAAVPAGLSAAGLPLSVQLLGRRDDEATLLSLAAQIEGARPWADRRPPLA